MPASSRACLIASCSSSSRSPKPANASADASARRSAVSIVSANSPNCDSSASVSTADSDRRSSSVSTGSHVVSRRARSATACSSGPGEGSLRRTSCRAASTALSRDASTPSSAACRDAVRPIAPVESPADPEYVPPSWGCIHSLESDHCSARALASSRRVIVPASTRTWPSGLPVRDWTSAASSSWASVTYPCERRMAPMVRRSDPVETVACSLISGHLRRLEPRDRGTARRWPRRRGESRM